MVRDTKLYDVLGVAPDASDDDIRRAYKKLVAQWHPDKNVGNEEKATSKFKEIQHAHSIISDPQKRRIYDQVGEEGLNAAGPDPSAAGPFGGGFAPAGEGRTFVFTGNGGQSVPPEMLQQLFSAFGGGAGGAAFGGGSGAQQTFVFKSSGGDDAMDFDGAGGLFGGMFGGGMPRAPRPRAGKRTAGPFYVGAQVRATGLTGAPQLNGKVGTVTGTSDTGRIQVAFDGSAEKALRPANLRAIDAGGWAKGAAVVAEGLSGASHLNGRRGNVIGPAPNGRVEVLFDGDGAKALQPANISPAA